VSAFRSVLFAVLALCLLTLAGCSPGPKQQRELAEAFAGPATLKVREEIDPRSPTVVTVKHGERLGIVGRRRRFVKVRTAGGVEGWTDVRQLLTPGQMRELDLLAEKARSLPSHGAAGVYEPLNVHTDPNRTAPSFYQITKGELVHVVESVTLPRVPFDPPELIPKPPPPPPRVRKPKAEPRIPPVPMPAAPQPPENWLELSKTLSPPPEAEPPKPPPEKPVPVDDWSLVRLPNGRAGWVLTRMLRMDIPDEVAQYSEGNRITSYFAMAEVNDGGTVKHNWLWTTLSDTRQPYQFDSFRYFIWNTRRHRYETAYIEKNLKGYFPVEVHPVKAAVSKQEQTFPGFSVIVEDNTGVRWRKTYAFQFYRVVLVDKQRLEPPPAPGSPTAEEAAEAKPAERTPGFFARMKRTLAGLKQRVFGR
jgi:hypothetical protein